MKKEVMICMSGVYASDELGTVDIVCPGMYYFRNGKHFIRYEEKIAEDSLGTDTVCTFKFCKDSAELSRKGAVNSTLRYEPGKMYLITYSTPLQDFMVELKTDHIRLYESERELLLEIDYSVEIENSGKNEFQIKIRVSDDPERILA